MQTLVLLHWLYLHPHLHPQLHNSFTPHLSTVQYPLPSHPSSNPHLMAHILLTSPLRNGTLHFSHLTTNLPYIHIPTSTLQLVTPMSYPHHLPTQDLHKPCLTLTLNSSFPSLMALTPRAGFSRLSSTLSSLILMKAGRLRWWLYISMAKLALGTDTIK